MKSSTRAIAVAIAGVTSIVFARSALAQEPAQHVETPVNPASGEKAAAQGTPLPDPNATPPDADGAVRAPSAAAKPEVPEGAADPSAKPAIPEWMRGVTLGGGVILYYYQPIGIDGAKNNASVYFANLLLDGKWGDFGLHFEPRFRDTKLRSFYDAPVWLQEAYASADFGAARLRIGKTYSRLGLFWDNSFYGNVQVYDGLKLDPDYGLSLDGDVGKKEDVVSLGWWAQYFVVDGGTNVSLTGRDTISIPGARRRNQAIARVEPRLHLGSTTIAIGASGEYLQADLPVIGSQDVWRAAGDVKVTSGKLGAWGEVLHQDGRTVTDFPYAGAAATNVSPAILGRSSSKVDYVLAGVEYTVGPVTGRYNVSYGNYHDVSVSELMHVPALGFALSPNISLLGELVIWRRSAPEGSSFVDRSLNVTLNAHL